MTDTPDNQSASAPDDGATPPANIRAFEASLEELKGIVEQMESGAMTLDESLQAFERGVELTRQCQNALTAAQERIQVLTRVDGALTTVDLEPTDSDA